MLGWVGRRRSGTREHPWKWQFHRKCGADERRDGVGDISSSNWRRTKIIKGFFMCFKKYRIENVQISSEMKRDTCSAMVRNHQRLRVRCSSGTVLGLYCSHSSPAPDSIRSTTMFMSSYNYPHFENEEKWCSEWPRPSQDPMSWGSMWQNFNPLHSKRQGGRRVFPPWRQSSAGDSKRLRRRWWMGSFLYSL